MRKVWGEIGTPLPKSLVEKIKVMEKVQKFNFPGNWEIMAQEKCINKMMINISN